MPNFKIIIEYDGGVYHGWQRQNNQATLQGVIEAAIGTMTQQKVTLNASGRTDAGVHALGQVANFRVETALTAEVFFNGLNSLLNDDIVIKDCRVVDESFHARFDAKSKLYHYHIQNSPLPSAIKRQYVWYIKRPLDMDKIQAAANHLMGEHDFKSFEGSGSPRAHTTRSIYRAEISTDKPGRLRFAIKANGFLRFMVRNIVGTLAEVGLGEITPAQFLGILQAKDRNLASPTAPPQGLFLVQVNY